MDERRVFQELSERGLTAADYDHIKDDFFDAVTPEEVLSSNAIFSEKTFILLDDLKVDPSREYVTGKRSSLFTLIEKPLSYLFEQVASGLHPVVDAYLDTYDFLLKDPFIKNKWTHDKTIFPYCWGSIHPKNGSKHEDGQLFIWINSARIEFGFFIGPYGFKQKARFKSNLLKYGKVIKCLLGDALKDLKVYKINEDAGLCPVSIEPTGYYTWYDWVTKLDDFNVYFSVSRSRSFLLGISNHEIVIDQITELFHNIFPLLLMSYLDDPMQLIRDIFFNEAEINGDNYNISSLSEDTCLPIEEIKSWAELIENKRHIIFCGPPGTGKTYISKYFAKFLSYKDGFYEIIQFHQSYEYEDFIQGIRPKVNEGGVVEYPLVPGSFMKFINRAKTKKGNCVLILDEINRANVSRVFGELLYLLEYRDECIALAGGGQLSIPSNVLIIGTMNTADRSIAIVDHALRRRFAFINIFPDYNILSTYHAKKGIDVSRLIAMLKEINSKIEDSRYALGISYFLIDNLQKRLQDIWQTQIEPYLEEILIDQQEIIDEYRWNSVQGKLV